MAVVAANWSELPKDLLYLISQRIDNENDLIRFRSICSTWRSSSIPNHHTNILPFIFNFPLLRYVRAYIHDSDRDNEEASNTNNILFCSLSKRNIFLIKSPPQQQQTLVHLPWLIRVTHNSYGKSKLHTSLLNFPFSLDLNKFSVHHLGTDFIIDKSLPYGCMSPQKVVAVTRVILAVLLGYHRQLVLFRCGDESWTDIPDMSSSIGDICVFKGQIYAVEENSGKTVTIGPEDLSVQLVASYKQGSPLLFLVESEGELLLVDVDESLLFESDDIEDVFWSYSTILEDGLTINVFRLDEKERKWAKLTSLGDRILFLGNGCSFSASDLSVAKGNCVIFMDNVFKKFKNIVDSYNGMCVFDLEQGQCLPLCHHRDYSLLLRSPLAIVS
jgi:hypothetical protein